MGFCQDFPNYNPWVKNGPALGLSYCLKLEDQSLKLEGTGFDIRCMKTAKLNLWHLVLSFI